MSPRAYDGTVTLVAGNPVVADTDIVTTWANPTMADIAAMLQDSLSRSGKGGMLVPVPFEDGTVATPSISFKNEPTTGFYRPSAGVLGSAVLGVQRLRLTTTGAVVTGLMNVTSDLAVSGNLVVTGSMGITPSDLPAVNIRASASSGA